MRKEREVFTTSGTYPWSLNLHVRSTFLHEKVNFGRFYKLTEKDLNMSAMFLQIINDVCMTITISPANI